MMTSIRALGIRQNAFQFSVLVLINAFVGAMIGMERSHFPVWAEKSFKMTEHTAALSFIAVFGFFKAFSNFAAGKFCQRLGRKPVLVLGWILALPVPWLLVHTGKWSVVLLANALLGISQGLTWSSAVIMKIDISGPKQRGLAMGLNEFAGYLALALSAFYTGYLANQSALGGHVFKVGYLYAGAGFLLSLLIARETKEFSVQESTEQREPGGHLPLPLSRSSRLACNQAGFFNNLNDGMAWGLFPLLFFERGFSHTQTGIIASIYPAAWGVSQIAMGAVSDRIGRKPLITVGLLLQGAAILGVSYVRQISSLYQLAIILGLGTAFVYPTLLAAVSDHATPESRANQVGKYRFWRDLGYVIGALGSGLVADFFGLIPAIFAVGILTGLSGIAFKLLFYEAKPA